ncbi:MAG: phosphoribosylanthranilate isomerase, partial [Candidatus Omnitrophica bacterium]|nr:phosphoribosylanthranilate isomerase [Candidatus Omnitrophota bacterium]
MIKVKICGITNLEDALMASYLGADALGFIFSPKSPRSLAPAAAEKIIAGLDPLVTKVGVFLDQDQAEVLEIASRLKLDVVQFHGKEKAAYCNFFTKRFKVIKVFFPEDRPYQKTIRSYKVDAFMFDIKYEQKIKGSNRLSGLDLDEIASLIKSGKRVVISGGLNS